ALALAIAHRSPAVLRLRPADRARELGPLVQQPYDPAVEGIDPPPQPSQLGRLARANAISHQWRPRTDPRSPRERAGIPACPGPRTTPQRRRAGNSPFGTARAWPGRRGGPPRTA